MKIVRPAAAEDLERIAEIEVFNYRLYFYPIFRTDAFFFDELRVSARIRHYETELPGLWVWDDGTVKGFCHIVGREVRKLFVEPACHSAGIGGALLDHAVEYLNVNELWALEKNRRAIAFYARHGFYPTGERRPEEDTNEYLIRLAR